MRSSATKNDVSAKPYRPAEHKPLTSKHNRLSDRIAATYVTADGWIIEPGWGAPKEFIRWLALTSR